CHAGRFGAHGRAGKSARRPHPARIADVVLVGGRQALWPHRRGAQCQLQDRGQRLLPAQAEAQRQESAGADPRGGTAPRGRVIRNAGIGAKGESPFQTSSRVKLGEGAGYFRSRTRERPAALLNSLASIVPSLSGLAALKRFSTSARNSFLSRVPSLSGSAAAKSLALSRPRNSRLSRVPS